MHPDPRKRYGELSEFIFDLRHPNESFLRSASAPLIERNPLLFWKGLSFVLAARCWCCWRCTSAADFLPFAESAKGRCRRHTATEGS